MTCLVAWRTMIKRAYLVVWKMILKELAWLLHRRSEWLWPSFRWASRTSPPSNRGSAWQGNNFVLFWIWFCFFANTNTGLAEKHIVLFLIWFCFLQTQILACQRNTLSQWICFNCLPAAVNSWSLPIQVDGVSDTAPTGLVALRGDEDDKTCHFERQWW